MTNQTRTEPLDRLAELEQAATPGPWRGTTIGNYDQKHAAAAAFEAVMARRLADSPDVQFSDLSWVQTEGDDWLNVALIGNGKDGPENAAFIAALRNAAPSLIAEAREAARLRSALEDIAAVGHRYDAGDKVRAMAQAALDGGLWENPERRQLADNLIDAVEEALGSEMLPGNIHGRLQMAYDDVVAEANR